MLEKAIEVWSVILNKSTSVVHASHSHEKVLIDYPVVAGATTQ
jgi:hypothetical protein